MAELKDAEVDAALERGQEHFATAPLALSARYDRDRHAIVLDLINGCSFTFPPRLIQGLEEAGEDDVAAVALAPDGYALHWDVGDIDITVGGLLAGRFGSNAHMERLAARRSVLDAKVGDGPRAMAS